MSKTNKIIYWVATTLLVAGMIGQGVQQVMHADAFVEIFKPLGYPLYFMTIIGTWKLLGVVAILLPGFKLLKEWAYAGFFFVMSGAVFSHMAVADDFVKAVPGLVVCILIIVSWYFRPADRKIVTN